MTKNKTTKRALLVSVLALLLCASLLVGSTFAWFTDNVTSTNNIIKSGNLDVKLEYSTDLSTWAEVGAKTDIFKNEDGTTDLWEPGFTEVVYLKVSNVGSLALKYALEVTVADEKQGTNQAGEKFSLSQYIKYDVVKYTAEEPYENRDDAVAAVPNAVALKTGIPAISNVSLAPKTENTIDSDVLALVVYMPTTVGNVANHNGEDIPTINLGITLNATQLAYEEDSFGPDYDEDAFYYDALATTEAELVAAVADPDVKVIAISGKVPFTAASAGASTDMGGVTLVGITDDATLEVVGTGGGLSNVNMKNLSVIDSTFYTSENGENAWEFTYLELEGTNTFKNVVFTDGVFFEGDNTCINCTFMGHDNDSSEYGTTTMYGAWVYDGKASFTGCSFSGTRGLKVADQYSGSDVNDVVVDNCTFGPLTEKPGIAVDNRLGALKLVIKNSNFAGTQPGDGASNADNGVPYIYENDNRTPAVTEIVLENNLVSMYYDVNSASDLATELGKAGAAGAGNTVIRLNADLNMTGINWTPISVDGYHGADIVTIDGQGHTITGLTAPLFAGGFAGGSGIVIKDLTIADSEIVSKNTLGSGAFIESVDSMALITLTNCHLKNSTVTGGAGSRTGGLIGWTAGYNNVNDGPVKTYVTIEDCSVIECTITCDGSVGGIYGHAGNNAWTYSTVKNCTVKDCKLNSTDDGDWRVGVVVGTANVGELTISGITASGNTLTQTGKTAPAGQSDLYGRFVPGSTGKLTIDGVAIN